MPSLSYDKHGNLVPYEISIISFETFKHFFVEAFEPSIARGILYELYLDFVNDFSNEFTPEFVHWIGGSFVTTKSNPNDIDVATLVEITPQLEEKSDILQKFTSKGYSKQTYNIDNYLIPVYDIRDSRYIFTQNSVQYWKDWFSHDRNKRKKGLIQLNYSQNE